MFCRKCGQEVKEGARFCTKCGTQVPQPAIQEPAETLQPQPLSPPVEPKSKKMGIIFVIVCVIMAVILICVLVFRGVDEKSGRDREEEAFEKTTEDNKNQQIKENRDSKENQNSKENTTSEEGGEASSQEESVPETEKTESEESSENSNDQQAQRENADMTLEDYAKNLEMSPINGMQYNFTEMKPGTYAYITEGLKKATGTITYTITDLDQDNQNELLVFWLEESQNGGNDIWAHVYEKTQDGIVKTAEMLLMEGLFGSYCDSANARFMLVQNKYICMDSQISTYLAADGTGLGMRMLTYDGTSLSDYLSEYVAGSDFYEVGKEHVETIRKLRAVNLNKSADNIEQRDTFTFCAADSDIQMLAKIRIDNSYSYEHRHVAPVATCYLIDGKTVANPYVLPQSAETYLSRNDIKNLNGDMLRIARNEIYARYGWNFEDEGLQAYFNNQIWYVPANGLSVEDNQLTEVEIANRDLIRSME